MIHRNLALILCLGVVLGLSAGCNAPTATTPGPSSSREQTLRMLAAHPFWRHTVSTVQVEALLDKMSRLSRDEVFFVDDECRTAVEHRIPEHLQQERAFARPEGLRNRQFHIVMWQWSVEPTREQLHAALASALAEAHYKWK